MAGLRLDCITGDFQRSPLGSVLDPRQNLPISNQCNYLAAFDLSGLKFPCIPLLLASSRLCLEDGYELDAGETLGGRESPLQKVTTERKREAT